MMLTGIDEKWHKARSEKQDREGVVALYLDFECFERIFSTSKLKTKSTYRFVPKQFVHQSAGKLRHVLIQDCLKILFELSICHRISFSP